MLISSAQESRQTAPETIGSGYYALMRLDEFVASRVVEAVVHGIDLTDALGRPSIATPAGLTDNMAWVRAASGRTEHPDPGYRSSVDGRHLSNSLYSRSRSR